MYIHHLVTTRVNRVSVIEFNESFYVRLWDIAQLLGVKQPFQLVADMKEFLGEEAILSGEATEPYRFKEDTSRALYMEVRNVVFYLRRARIRQKFSNNIKAQLVTELEAFME